MRMVTSVIDSTGSDEERMSNNKNVITHMNKGILHVLFYRKEESPLQKGKTRLVFSNTFPSFFVPQVRKRECVKKRHR